MSLAASIGDAVIWYLVATALAALVFPIIFRVASPLPDRGWSLARPLGLLIAVLPSWWLSAIDLTPFKNWLIVLLAVLLGIAGWAIGLGTRRRDFTEFLSSKWRTIVLLEIFCLIAFIGYVVFRGYNPAIAYTEKPMDLAFLTSSIHAHAMPPLDPWFAGQRINYYYLGYLLMAVLARLSGIPASIAFNLSLATLFAFATTAAAGTAANIVAAANLSRRLRFAGGLLGAAFLAGVGNLVAVVRLIEHPAATLQTGWWEGVGWTASRVIVDHGVPGATGPRQTINEFPAFSFVLGDLHPHLLALPIFISTIGLSFALYRSMYCAAGEKKSGPALGLPIVAGVVAGALYAINAWDMPTAILLTCGAVWVGAGTSRWREALRHTVAIIIGAIIVALPFALHFTAAVGANTSGIPAPLLDVPIVGRIVRTIGIVTWSRSGFIPLLKIYGLFLAITLLVLVALWRRIAPERRPSLAKIALFVVVVAVVSVAIHTSALLLFGVPIVLLWIFLMRRREVGEAHYLGWLVGVACFLVLVPEFFYLQDVFGDRMNTVFKAYFQAWAVFAVAGAAAVVACLAYLKRDHRRTAFRIGLAAIIVLILGAAVYTPISIYRWDNQFNHWQGIDGLAYLKESNPAEAAGIDWLLQHATYGQVVLEAPGCSYGVSSGIPDDRVSLSTGLPTVIGWEGHELQWRNGKSAQVADINTRQSDVNAIYTNPTSPRSRSLLDAYHVEYIYVGSLERDGDGSGCNAGPPYPAASLAQISQLGWPVVFNQGDVTIYRRPG